MSTTSGLCSTAVATASVPLLASATTSTPAKTVVSGALFPLLALGTLGFELWLGALAIHWLREHSSK